MKPKAPSKELSTANKAPEGLHRIAKLLARAGIASRRDVERMIGEGRVALNGTQLTTPATLLATLEGVTVDGQPVAAAEATRLWLFHKPVGCVTTTFDPKGRPTVFTVFGAALPRVVTVGRLDYNTAGLLLLTNDGGLKRRFELPATGMERVYRVRVRGYCDVAKLAGLRNGVTIEGQRYGAILAFQDSRTGANAWLTMTITEGKNREIRKICDYLGLQVTRLIRIAYGPFLLDDLPIGAWVEVPQALLRKTLQQGAIGVAELPAPPERQTGNRKRTLASLAGNQAAPVAKPVAKKPSKTPTRPADKAKRSARHRR
jgi:23S rRNA pseudouridine2605 synthase